MLPYQAQIIRAAVAAAETYVDEMARHGTLLSPQDEQQLKTLFAVSQLAMAVEVAKRDPSAIAQIALIDGEMVDHELTHLIRPR